MDKLIRKEYVYMVYMLYFTQAHFKLEKVIETANNVGWDIICSKKDNPKHLTLAPVKEHLDALLRILYQKVEPDVITHEYFRDSLLALAHMNTFMDAFEKELGITLDCDAFAGHLYGVLTALRKGIDMLCAIDTSDEELCEYLDTTNLTNHVDVMRRLYQTYYPNIQANIKLVNKELIAN